MLQIILSGAGGKMGRTIAALAQERGDCVIVAGLDVHPVSGAPFPIFQSPAACSVHADVVIDFSHPAMFTPLLAWTVGKKLPLVACTTGLSSGQVDEIHTAAKVIPLFYSANMSLGVNLMAALCEKAAAILGNDFDIEIIEKHHNQKIDAPSGTALMLADRISGALESPAQYVYDRHSKRQKRQKSEIGLHAVRGGTIVGEHEVLFAGTDEVLTISHAATSKQVFAAGALRAAAFLPGQTPGLYDMRDMV